MSSRTGLLLSGMILGVFLAVVGIANSLSGGKPGVVSPGKQPGKPKSTDPTNSGVGEGGGEVDLSKATDLAAELKALQHKPMFIYIEPAQLDDASLLAAKDAGLLPALLQAEGADGQRPAQLDQITSLDLQGTSVGDASVALLSSLPNLEQVYLGRSKVTSASVPSLFALPKLKYLEVDGKLLSDALLLEAQKAGKLHVLSFVRAVNPKAQSADEIEVLTLTHPGITDKCVPALLACKNLKKLFLNESQLSDAGLSQLAPLEKLEFLEIGKTKVSQKSADEFQKSKPKCFVNYYQ